MLQDGRGRPSAYPGTVARQGQSQAVGERFHEDSTDANAITCPNGTSLEYHASPWERSWRAHVSKSPDYSRGWRASCQLLKNDTRSIVAWESMWGERHTLKGALSVSGSRAWDRYVFSHHVVRDRCTVA